MANEKLGEQPRVAVRGDLVIPVIDPTQPAGFRNLTVLVSDLPGGSATLSDGSVTNIKLANVPELTVKARLDAGTGPASDVSVALLPLSTAAAVADAAVAAAATAADAVVVSTAAASAAVADAAVTAAAVAADTVVANAAAAATALKLSLAGGTMSGPIIYATAPVLASELANKQYVLDTAAGLNKYGRARAATTANITIATALNNGDTLDGVVLATDDDVLVKNQTATAENGVYVVGVTPVRSTNFDTFAEHPGALIAVFEGTANNDTIWLCTANSGGTLGTTPITFDAYGAGGLAALNNLSDVSSPATSLANLGGVAATGGTLTNGTLASPTMTGVPVAPTAAALTSTTQVATTAFATTADALKANLAGPTFTGVPAAPTAAATTSTTQIATTAFVTTADNLKANLASPTLTGTPAAPTAAAATSTTQIATTAFVQGELTAKANLASPTFTGVPAMPTAAPGTSTTQGASTAFVTAAGALKANLASPTFTGVPAAPTATAGTSTTQVATTAFATAADLLKLNAAGGTLTGGILAGVTTRTGAATVSTTAMVSAVIDITAANPIKSIAASTEFSFSATPPAGREFEWGLVNSSTENPYTITFAAAGPQVFSMALGAVINTTGFWIAPGETISGYFKQTANRLELYGEQAAPSQPTRRGRRWALIGGSETMRGHRVLTVSASNVTRSGTTITVNTTGGLHLLHSGQNVFLSSADSVAPALVSGASLTFDNLVCFGVVTVLDNNTFTMQENALMPVVPGSTNTEQFVVHVLEHFSPNSKWNEKNRELSGSLNLDCNLSTGSNNSALLRMRVPYLCSRIRAGLVHEVGGSFGIGNSLLWASNHNTAGAAGTYTYDQLVTFIIGDLDYMVRSFANAGAMTTIELPPPPTDATGATISGQRFIIERIRQWAMDQTLKVRLEDHWSLFVNNATGQGKARLYRDSVHPSNEGVVFGGYNNAEMDRGFYSADCDRLIRSVLDCRKADSNSQQLCDYWGIPTTQTTIVAASSLDSKATGTVPETVLDIITSGNASRSVVCSYVASGDETGYECYFECTAAAIGDTFTFQIANPAGARALTTLLTSSKRYLAAIDYACVPRTATVDSCDVTFGMTATYGAVTALSGYLATDPSNQTSTSDGTLSQPRIGPAYFAEVTLPAGISAMAAAGFDITVVAATTGTFYVRASRPTIRLQN